MRIVPHPRNLKPNLVIWLAIPLILWWFGRGIALNEWQRMIFSIQPVQLSLLLFINLAALVFFSSRWWLILRALDHTIPYLKLLRYRMAAFSISYFTPGSQFGGEPFQVWALERNHGISRAKSLASVTAEKLFELLSNFTFLAVGITLILLDITQPQAGLTISDGFFAEPKAWLAAIWVIILLMLPLIYLALLRLNVSPVSYLAAKLPAGLRGRSWFCTLQVLIRDTEAQISSWVRQKPGSVLLVLAASLWFWLLTLAEYWLALHVLGATLSLPQTIVALTAARIAFLMPVPAGLGALEAGQVLALQALGFNPVLGITVSLWIRVRDLLLGSLGLLWSAALVQSRPAAVSAEAGD